MILGRIGINETSSWTLVNQLAIGFSTLFKSIKTPTLTTNASMESNPFQNNVRFLHPLKISENLLFLMFLVSMGHCLKFL